MEGSRLILVKVVLFQLRGRGPPQDSATPSFLPDSKSSILALSNEVSFVSKVFFAKVVKIEKIKLPFMTERKQLGMTVYLKIEICFNNMSSRMAKMAKEQKGEQKISSSSCTGGVNPSSSFSAFEIQ